MCDHADELPPNAEPTGPPNISRRGLLRGMFGLGAALVLPGTSRILRPVAANPTALANLTGPSGLSVVSNAMHIHASFSELDGSFDSHLSEAARCGINCVWWSDHDWRMSAFDYLTTLRFLNPETSNGTKVTYKASSSGSLSSSVCTLDSSVPSPNDTSGGTVHLMAKGSGSRRMNVQPSDHLRSNLTGETVRVDVLPMNLSGGYLEVLVNLSYHEAQLGRPTGMYQLSYRFSTVPAGRQAQGLLGIVNVPVTPGQWNLGVALDPVSDIGALWPDFLAPGDNNMNDLWFGVTAQNGGSAEGCFANVLIARSQTSGDDPITVQRNIIAALSERYPSVQSRHALEISGGPKHASWFGGDFHMPIYGQNLTFGAEVTGKAIQMIHGYGGLGSINHPFGVKQSGLSSQSTQDSERHKAAVKYLNAKAYGADILEVGYHQRGGASFDTHVKLWQTLCRNGLFQTGTGVSDNHTGHVNGWSVDKAHNTFQTSTWAASDSEADLLDALRAGRVFCGEILAFIGQLWQEVEGNPMGSVSISTASTRQLSVSATGLGSNQVVQVWRGVVDYAGSGSPDPIMTQVATLTAGDFKKGAATVTINTGTECFVHVFVYDTAAQRVVAFSNPNWLLHNQPPGGIPSGRLAPDTTTASQWS